jgi:quinol monooxygenase YgiN
VITEIIRYTIPLQSHQEFARDYEKAVRVLMKSPHCKGYELMRCEDNPDNWLLIIRWASVEAHLTGFRQSPEFSVFLELVKRYIPHIQEMKHYQTHRFAEAG